MYNLWRFWRANEPAKLTHQHRKVTRNMRVYQGKENTYSPGFVRTREVRLRGSSWSKLWVLGHWGRRRESVFVCMGANVQPNMCGESLNVSKRQLSFRFLSTRVALLSRHPIALSLWNSIEMPGGFICFGRIQKSLCDLVDIVIVLSRGMRARLLFLFSVLSFVLGFEVFWKMRISFTDFEFNLLMMDILDQIELCKRREDNYAVG